MNKEINSNKIRTQNGDQSVLTLTFQEELPLGLLEGMLTIDAYCLGYNGYFLENLEFESTLWSIPY